MTTLTLKKNIAKLPSGPGIYIFSNTRKRCLYIGKASNLKNRLNSYLKIDDLRIKKMLELANSLKILKTESDIEALILESQLIKKFRPQFNIVMRDDKQYAFVGFTHSTDSTGSPQASSGQAEKYPKIFVTHQPTKNQNYIGPFTDVGALKITLRYLRRIFPYCTCKQTHHNYCLNYHIGKCPGYCCLKNKLESTPTKDSYNLAVRTSYKNLKNYQKNLRIIKGILIGKNKSVIKNLQEEMTRLAKRGKLEKAIELRNKLEKLERIFKNAKIIRNISYYGIPKNHNEKILLGLKKILGLKIMLTRIEGYDVSNIQGTHATGAMVTFANGQPDKNFYRKFKIKTVHGANDTAMLKEILERRFRHNEWPFPDLILIDGGKAQLNAAHSVISNYYTTFLDKQRAPLLVALTKDERHQGDRVYIPGRKTPLLLTKLSPADKNLLLKINSEAHRFAIGYYRKLHRKLFR